MSAETIHSCVRTEFDSYLSLKAQTFNCKNKKTNTFSDCRSTSNQRTAPSVRQNPPRSRAVKWPLHYKQSIRGDGDGQTGGRWQWTHHSPPALTHIRRESISQPWRCPHTLCCTTWVKPAEQVEPALLMWIHSELRVSCYITDAWILMTALLGALFSSLLGLTYTQICTVCTVMRPRKQSHVSHAVEFAVGSTLESEEIF